MQQNPYNYEVTRALQYSSLLHFFKLVYKLLMLLIMCVKYTSSDVKRSKRDLRRSSTEYDLLPLVISLWFKKKHPRYAWSTGTAERLGCFFGKGFLQNIQLVRAPSVSMRSYVGTKLVLDFRIKKIIRASGLQTRSIFNRVQVRV